MAEPPTGYTKRSIVVALRERFGPTPLLSNANACLRITHVDGFGEKVSFIWSIAELLRGDYKASEYGKVILPFVLLRRLDCVLEPTKAKVIAENARLKVKNVDPVLRRVAGQAFYNTSPLDFKKLLGDPGHIAANLRSYIAKFSDNAADILTNFTFDEEITRLDKANLLYLVVSKFASNEIDLHPDRVSNTEMGYIFEELIRRFSEQSNETAGEHFTPREVIRLMVNLLFAGDAELLQVPGTIRSIYDPASGTGGMLSVAEDRLREINEHARLEVFGQELNPESYAICKADMLIKGQDPARIHLGNSFSNDREPNTKFDYMLSNPPFGVDWKKIQQNIETEYALGHNGRFGAGLPRINDGSLLFLQHMVSKMKSPSQGGSRVAIVFNASPLQTGGPDSGESKIRQWLIESDWVDAIVALPHDLFYNTGIATFVWIITNRKEKRRQGRVHLIDGRSYFRKMRKSLGNKRNELAPEHIDALTQLYLAFTDGEASKVFTNRSFGYRRIAIEQPLRLRYEINDDTLASLQEALSMERDSKPAKGKHTADMSAQDNGESVLRRLASLNPTSTSDRDIFANVLRDSVFEGRTPRPKLDKAIWSAFAVPDPSGPIVLDKKGIPVADPELRTDEDVPLDEQPEAYFAREVLPHLPDAWLGVEKTRTGYEVPFARHFFRYHPPRPIQQIDADIRALEAEIMERLNEVSRG
jgi:type I restriction enzyme M protein